MREPFVWNQVEHWTGVDLMETILLVSTEEEAADFMEAYIAACEDEEHAIHNLRYMLDIIAHDSDDPDAQENAQEASDLFMVDLPGPDEVLSPRNWWKDSSAGIKVPA